MADIGKINELKVYRENASGYYLEADGFDEDIFMPPALGPLKVAVGDVLKVFLYLDKSDSIIATTSLPVASLGEFGLMEVVQTQTYGAFLDWGIDKDLFVPDTEQRERLRLGELHVIRVCQDEQTERLYGTTKINKYIQATEFDIADGDKVELVPAIKEQLGYRCIINKKYIGMIYHNEIFEDLIIGIPRQGVVKKIREDGLVDAALQVQGIKNLVSSKDKILGYLEAQGGKSPLNDKSKPEDIKAALGMSKKTFKSTIGMLYKERKILISPQGIELKK